MWDKLDEKFNIDTYFNMDKKVSLTLTFDNELQLPALMDAVARLATDLEKAGSKTALPALLSIKEQIQNPKNYKEVL